MGSAFCSVMQFCVFQSPSAGSFLQSQGRNLSGHLIFCPVLIHRLLSGPITRSGWRPK